jgi:hypothetical protein
MAPVKIVGYKLNSADFLSTLARFTKNVPELPPLIEWMTLYNPTVRSGVWYSPNCKGALEDTVKSIEHCDAWYKQRAGHNVTGSVRQIYVNKHYIVARIQCASDCFYAILSDTTAGSGTFRVKKEIERGYFGGKIIVLEDLKIDLEPYVFDS